MCGICGIAGFGDRQTIEQMASVVAHRGPDDAGAKFFPDHQLGLGHTRLSIIDLSPAGHQPMSNEDGRVWIIFNGEIYNFQELRRDLDCRHHMKSSTDTEVVLHLYEEQGVSVLDHLNGMFAFAIYDSRPPGPKHPNSPSLFLARDRLGIKPLYYFRDGRRFIFGSEIKAILASRAYSPAVDWQSLCDYLTYLYVPYPSTIFRRISQLPPAHALELDLEKGDVRLWRYWSVKGPENGPSPGKGEVHYQEAKENLRRLLADSVRRQMISDVPLGVFLSGGVDSSILTGLMAEASSRPVKTFTIVFRGKDLDFYNEQERARAVANMFGTEHHEIDVEIADPTEMLDLVEFFDQPFGNPTFYLMYLISRHARPEVTVALCGSGGDELFAGYPRYQAHAIARRLRFIPRPLLKGVQQLLRFTSDDYRNMRLHRARRFMEGLDSDDARQFVKWTYFFDEDAKAQVLHPSLRHESSWGEAFLPADRNARQHLLDSPFDDSGNRLLHLDVQTFLVDNILEYTDKMSMAVALEVRVPYLDHRVVESSLSMPFSYKLRGAESKVILKDAFHDLLPSGSAHAQKKGFNVPLAIWMRDFLGQYFDRYMSRVEVERIGIFNWEHIQRLRKQHNTGKRDNSYELFSLIMFDVWRRKYIP